MQQIALYDSIASYNLHTYCLNLQPAIRKSYLLQAVSRPKKKRHGFATIDTSSKTTEKNKGFQIHKIILGNNTDTNVNRFPAPTGRLTKGEIVMYKYDRKGPKRGVALYSYSAEFGLTKTLEDCFEDVHDMGAHGIEILANTHIENYPYPTDEWVENWFSFATNMKSFR